MQLLDTNGPLNYLQAFMRLQYSYKIIISFSLNILLGPAHACMPDLAAGALRIDYSAILIP